MMSHSSIHALANIQPSNLPSNNGSRGGGLVRVVSDQHKSHSFCNHHKISRGSHQCRRHSALASIPVRVATTHATTGSSPATTTNTDPKTTMISQSKYYHRHVEQRWQAGPMSSVVDPRARPPTRAVRRPTMKHNKNDTFSSSSSSTTWTSLSAATAAAATTPVAAAGDTAADNTVQDIGSPSAVVPVPPPVPVRNRRGSISTISTFTSVGSTGLYTDDEIALLPLSAAAARWGAEGGGASPSLASTRSTRKHIDGDTDASDDTTEMIDDRCCSSPSSPIASGSCSSMMSFDGAPKKPRRCSSPVPPRRGKHRGGFKTNTTTAAAAAAAAVDTNHDSGPPPLLSPSVHSMSYSTTTAATFSPECCGTSGGSGTSGGCEVFPTLKSLRMDDDDQDHEKDGVAAPTAIAGTSSPFHSAGSFSSSSGSSSSSSVSAALSLLVETTEARSFLWEEEEDEYCDDSEEEGEASCSIYRGNDIIADPPAHNNLLCPPPSSPVSAKSKTSTASSSTTSSSIKNDLQLDTSSLSTIEHRNRPLLSPPPVRRILPNAA